MIEDEIDYLDCPCPRCGAHEVRRRGCDEIGCEDGWYDEHDCDAINFAPGESYSMCEECCGTGDLVWCSSCGLDITRHEHMKSLAATPEPRDE